MSYTVMVDVMDVIDKSAGEWADGRPKKIDELYEGAEDDLKDVDAERIQVLKDLGAIKDTSAVQQEQKQADQEAKKAEDEAEKAEKAQ